MTDEAAAVLDRLAANRQLGGFVRAGQIHTMPTKWSRRRELLAEVAQLFEPGIRYPEAAVNDLLLTLYPAAPRSAGTWSTRSSWTGQTVSTGGSAAR